MPRTMSVADSIVIDAPPAHMYEQLSDPTAMGRWSPENRGATVEEIGAARTSAWSSRAGTSAVP